MVLATVSCAIVCVSLRDGSVVELLARWLVPGDVVHLNTGDRVPADMRLIEVSCSCNGSVGFW